MNRLILVVMCVFMLAVPAQAEVTGVYGGVKFIDSIQNRWYSGTLSGSYTQNTVGGGIFAGYDFYHKANIPVRAEIEYALRTAATKSDSTQAWGLTADAKGTWYFQTLMANFYFDFHNSSQFTPYVGAGVGMAFVTSKYSADVNFAGLAYSWDKSKTDTVFAWNIGAGCAYAFTENFSADLGYRYLGTGESKVSFDNFMGVDLGDAKSFAGAHEISLGLRFTF